MAFHLQPLWYDQRISENVSETIIQNCLLCFHKKWVCAHVSQWQIKLSVKTSWQNRKPEAFLWISSIALTFSNLGPPNEFVESIWYGIESSIYVIGRKCEMRKVCYRNLCEELINDLKKWRRKSFTTVRIQNHYALNIHEIWRRSYGRRFLYLAEDKSLGKWVEIHIK